MFQEIIAKNIYIFFIILDGKFFSHRYENISRRSLSFSFRLFPSVSDKILNIIFRWIRREKSAISRINGERKSGQRMNRRSREVGFIFIAAIRQASTPGVVGPRGRQGPTSLGQSVAVVIINDATSNATSTFSPPLFPSSCLLPSPLLSLYPRTADSSLLPRFVPPSFRVPAFEIHDRLGTLYRVSIVCII